MKVNPSLIKLYNRFCVIKKITNITQTTGRNELKIAVKVD